MAERETGEECTQCGSILPQRANFCPRCGSPAPTPEPAGSETDVPRRWEATPVEAGGAPAAEAPAPEVPAPAAAAPPTPAPVSFSRPGRGLWVAGLGIVAVLVIALLLSLRSPTAGTDQLLVGELDRAGTADLYLVSAGEQLRRDAEIVDNVRPLRAMSYADDTGRTGAAAGLLVVGDATVILTVSETGTEAVLAMVTEAGLEEIESFRAVADVAAVGIESELLVYAEDSGGRARCYAGPPTDLRRARGDGCAMNPTGTVFVSWDEDANGAELRVATRDGDETDLIDADVEILDPIAITSDGSLIGVLTRDLDGGSGERVQIFEIGNEEALLTDEADDVRLAAGLAAMHEAKILIRHRRVAAGEEELVLFDADRGDIRIAELDADRFEQWTLDSTGRYVLYTVRETDGVQTMLVSHDTETGAEVELADAESLLDFAVTGRDTIVAVTGDGDVVRSDLAGTDIDEIGRVRGDSERTEFYAAGSGLGIWTPTLGRRVGTFYAADSERVTAVLEDWDSISSVTRIPGTDAVIVVGRETIRSEPVVMRIDLRRAEVLDLDGDALGFADFTIVGDDLLYSARIRDGADDWEVRRVPLGGGEPERQYRTARVLGGGLPLFDARLPSPSRP